MNRSKWRKFGFLGGPLFMAALIGAAAAQAAEPGFVSREPAKMTASKTAAPFISPPVRDLPVMDSLMAGSREAVEVNPRYMPDKQLLDWDAPPAGLPAPTRAPNLALPFTNAFEPFLQFEGISFTGVVPPDPIGDVGPNHYVQAVNSAFGGTEVIIFDKSGNVLAGPFGLSGLWAGTGTLCETAGHGDPVVLYDSIADRWLIAQFAWDDLSNGPWEIAVALSQTPDPLGSYYLYCFNAFAFPDYLKFAVWPDAYYMSANEGPPNVGVYAFEREAMLDGDTATFISTAVETNFLLPCDLDGAALPPQGSPNYFYTFMDSEYWGSQIGIPGPDRLELWESHVDWDDPDNSSFTLTNEIPVEPFDYTVCGYFVRNCIPQPETDQGFSPVSEWPMWRLVYRNFGDHETLLGNFTVNVDGTAGIRWFELRNPDGAEWNLHQEGTHAPDDDHRFMGSIAMDGEGNIALGYSVSSETVFPSIRHTARFANDPLGVLRPETSMIEGEASQDFSNRWGDYTSMNIDPADDRTFWYTNQYIDPDTGFWSTRIGAFTVTNDPPVFASTPPATFHPDLGYRYPIETIDLEGDPIAISAIQKPAWLDFTDNGGGTALLEGVPAPADLPNAPFDIVLEASDGENTAQQSFQIDLSEAPVFTTSPLTDILSGETYSYSIAAADSPGDTVTLSAPSLPGWLTLTPAGPGAAELTGAPTDADAANNPHAVTIIASDGTNQSEQTFSIHVESIPQFTSAPATQAVEDVEYVYEIAAADADGDPVAIQAVTAPGWLSFQDIAPGSARLAGIPSQTDAEASPHTVTLRAGDGERFSEQTFQIDVEIVNDPPAITSSPIHFANVGDTYQYPFLADDEETASPNLAAVQIPAWLALSATAPGEALLEGIPSLSDLFSQPYEIVLTAGDGENEVEQTYPLGVTRYTHTPPAAGPPLNIPDNEPAGVSSAIEIAESAAIADLDIRLDISHTWVGDLTVGLEHGGITAVLIDRPRRGDAGFGSSADNIHIVLNTQARLSAENDANQGGAAAYTANQHYRPNEPLSAFNGQSLAGTWTLTVIDHAGGDTGVLEGWSLLATAEADIPAVPVLGGFGAAALALLMLGAGAAATILGQRNNR